jgi:hypothetical protein
MQGSSSEPRRQPNPVGGRSKEPGETIDVGLWVRTHTIREFRPGTIGVKHVNWQFASTELLIRWEAVVTIQAFESSGKEIGFKSTSEG